MVSLKSLLTWLSLLFLVAAHPIDSPATLGKRGYGWLENSRGTSAYRCEYHGNLFFDRIHLAGRNSTATEEQVKRAAKKASAVTGWRWRNLGKGSFDVRVSGFFSPCFAFFFLFWGGFSGAW